MDSLTKLSDSLGVLNPSVSANATTKGQVMSSTKEHKAIDELLNILHIIAFDGAFTDGEAVTETLLEIGVSQDIIDYHAPSRDRC